MRGDQRNSLRLKATPAKAGKKYLPTRVPTTSWIMIAHLLVEVEEAALGPVLDGVGAEDGGVDLGHGVEQGVEPLLLVALVGQEEALVLPGEGGPQAVLEEARAADDERHVAEVVQGDRQALDDLGREGASS